MPEARAAELERVTIRGQSVRLHPGTHARSWCAYQGRDYFMFRRYATADRWLMSQSPEDRLHDPEHVVGRGASIQDAADDFSAASYRHVGRSSYVPTITRGCDLAAASIETLVMVLGEAVRLGYHDERQGHQRRPACQIADTLALLRFTGHQQLQLGQAYKAGREHLVVERIQRGGR